MQTVTFKYVMDEIVVVNLTNETGVIAMLAYDDGGIQYFVKTKDSSNWWKETQIRKAG